MKNFLLLPLLILFAHVPTLSQKNKKELSEYKIPMLASRWTFEEGKVEFLEYKGIAAIKILPNSGHVIAKDLIFKDGTIEFDIEPTGGFAQSIYFRRQSDKEAEIFYLRARAGMPFANDAIQYAPIIDAVNLWDLYDPFQAPALIKEKEWNHVKLVIAGLQMRVFVNDMTRPALQITRLEANVNEGAIAFDGQCMLTNVQVKPNQTEGLPTTEAPDLSDHDANYLRKWVTTKPANFPTGSELHLSMLPKTEDYLELIDAERRGLLNLTRKFGKSDQRRVTWMKINIQSVTAQSKILQLGFSDEVWVFINGQMTFVDKNIYRQSPMRKYPDGRISVLNSSIPLSLKQGQNELIIGVANDFFGWGIMARLENMDGIEFVK